MTSESASDTTYGTAKRHRHRISKAASGCLLIVAVGGIIMASETPSRSRDIQITTSKLRAAGVVSTSLPAGSPQSTTIPADLTDAQYRSELESLTKGATGESLEIRSISSLTIKRASMASLTTALEGTPFAAGLEGNTLPEGAMVYVVGANGTIVDDTGSVVPWEYDVYGPGSTEPMIVMRQPSQGSNDWFAALVDSPSTLAN